MAGFSVSLAIRFHKDPHFFDRHALRVGQRHRERHELAIPGYDP